MKGELKKAMVTYYDFITGYENLLRDGGEFYGVPFAMHVSGFKYREIAEKLDLPLGTVKSRIFFTRQRLQEELKDFR